MKIKKSLKNILLCFTLIMSSITFLGISEVSAAVTLQEQNNFDRISENTIDFPPDNLEITPYAFPIYPGTSLQAKGGDVFYTTKSSTQYLTGHIAILDNHGYVIHARGVGYGIVRESIDNFLSRYSNEVSIYRAKNTTSGQQAAQKARELYNNYRDATYNVVTPLTEYFSTQYCTKVVWQSYYYGANINLDDLSLTKITVPPSWILDTNYLTNVASGLGTQ